MTNFPERQHWVPRFYLRKFTDSDGRVYAFDKRNRRAFPATPENVALKRDFYTADVMGGPLTEASYQLERDLERVYETPHSLLLRHVIDSLDSRQPRFDATIRSGLAELVALQLVRTPRFRDMGRKLAEQEAASPGVTLNADQFLKTAHLNLLNERGFVGRVAAHLVGMRINFLAVPSTTPLWTSDVPIVTGLTDPATGKMTLTKSQGIGREGAELYFPLSTRHVLVIFGSHVDLEDSKLRLMGDGYAEEFNRMMLTNADRQVFAPVPFDPLPDIA